MVTLEEYQLQYDLFLAEQEMFDSLISIGNGCINESMGLIYIHEGVKETILNYVEKIKTALLKAWEKFKAIIRSGKNVAFVKAIAKKMENPDPKGIIIENFYDYDVSKVDSITIQPFNYEEMKDSLSSKEDFINKYYNSLMKDNNKSLKENITESCYTIQPKVQCTKEMLINMYKFISKDFVDSMDKMSKEMKSMENNTANISALVNTVSPAETTIEAVSIYESFKLKILNEEEQPKMSFDNSSTAGGQNSQLVKHITTFLSVNTDIISAKMTCYRNIYSAYIKVIKNYLNPKPIKEK